MRCARHGDVETEISCGRCGVPICPRCSVHTGVGIRCQGCAPGEPRSAASRVSGLRLPMLVGIGITLVIIGAPLLQSILGTNSDPYADYYDDYDDYYNPVITIDEVQDPLNGHAPEQEPPSGHKLVAISLTAEHPGGETPFVTFSTHMFKLTDSEGLAYIPLDRDVTYDWIMLEPGEKTRRTVMFEVEESNSVASLTYSTTRLTLPNQTP